MFKVNYHSCKFVCTTNNIEPLSTKAVKIVFRDSNFYLKHTNFCSSLPKSVIGLHEIRKMDV